MKSRMILFFTFLIFAIGFFAYQMRSSKSCEEAYVELNSIVIKGHVRKKFVNYKNHALKSVILMDSGNTLDTFELFHFDENGIFDSIMSGDSLIKYSDSYNLRVFRKDKMMDLVIDYKCR